MLSRAVRDRNSGRRPARLRDQGDQSVQGEGRLALDAVGGERIYVATLKIRLDRAGVKPAFDQMKIGAVRNLASCDSLWRPLTSCQTYLRNHR